MKYLWYILLAIATGYGIFLMVAGKYVVSDFRSGSISENGSAVNLLNYFPTHDDLTLPLKISAYGGNRTVITSVNVYKGDQEVYDTGGENPYWGESIMVDKDDDAEYHLMVEVPVGLVTQGDSLDFTIVADRVDAVSSGTYEFENWEAEDVIHVTWPLLESGKTGGAISLRILQFLAMLAGACILAVAIMRMNYNIRNAAPGSDIIAVSMLLYIPIFAVIGYFHFASKMPGLFQMEGHIPAAVGMVVWIAALGLTVLEFHRRTGHKFNYG